MHELAVHIDHQKKNRLQYLFSSGCLLPEAACEAAFKPKAAVHFVDSSSWPGDAI
jgi:hypothetical protein